MKKILIHSWRSLWMDATLPFYYYYYVQIAPYIYSQQRGRRYVSNWESLPYFWEKQTECMNIPYTGMVVTTDLVDDDLFQNATAVIKGNKVILSSPKVSRPVKARFAWDEIAKPNLCNEEGLPAIPFRTDTSEPICKK